MPLAVHIIYSHPQIALTHGKGQKLANDQSVQGGIFAHTSLPISTPCSLPAAENLGLYIIFPQQQPPSLISEWKLWRSIGNREKTSSCDSATHANNSNSPQAVSDTSLSFWWPCTRPSFGLGEGNNEIYNSWSLWLPASWLYYLYLMGFKLRLKPLL